MRRKVFLMATLFVAAMSYGQTFEQTNFVLDEVLPHNKDIVYEASTSIKLLDGFLSNPDRNRSVKLSINRFGVFPPEEDRKSTRLNSSHL